MFLFLDLDVQKDSKVIDDLNTFMKKSNRFKLKICPIIVVVEL